MFAQWSVLSVRRFRNRLCVLLRTTSPFTSTYLPKWEKTDLQRLISVPTIHTLEKSHWVWNGNTKINLWHPSSWIKPFILCLHKCFIKTKKAQVHSQAPSGVFVQRKFWQRPNRTQRQWCSAAALTVKLSVPRRIKQVSILNNALRGKNDGSGLPLVPSPPCLQLPTDTTQGWPTTSPGSKPT